MTSKVWFITGTARGFGRVWTEAALKRGDKVAATARNTEALAPLIRTYGDAIFPIKLDVTDRAADFAAVAQAHERFGRLDVVVNNAGYGLFGAVEEISEAQARHEIDTNLLGALWITQAALPILRAQGSGHIIQISSIGGVIAFPDLGLYHASKWGLEGFSEALSIEVAQFGIHVTIIEPGGFATDWSGSSAVRADPLPAYQNERERMTQFRIGSGAKQGVPEASAEAILKVVDAEQPPLRIVLGPRIALIDQRYAERLETWKEWEDVGLAAQGN
jgi:NAD(P)-dependent dehydrogenase (short-subunit alcohol dehydrogenase family)